MGYDEKRQIALDGIREAMIKAGHTCWLTSWEEARDGKIFHCEEGREVEITAEEFGQFIANTI